MTITNDSGIYKKKMRGHGSKPKYYHKIAGRNFRLDAIQVAALNAKSKYLDEWSQKLGLEYIHIVNS